MTENIVPVNERAASLSIKENGGRMEETYQHGIFDIPNALYHSLPGISRSALSEFKKSPLHYWDKYLNPEKQPKKVTAAMKTGSAVHCLVLEPHIFDKEFAVLKPLIIDGKKAHGNSNAAKDYKNKFEQDNKDKIILDEDEYREAQEIAISIIEHPHTVGFLSGDFSVEKSIFWTDEDTGLVCKARPDIWQHNISVICDIKTTNDATLDTFTYAVRRSNYHIQAAMQIDAVFETTGTKIDNFCFITAPTERPFKPYIYVLDEDVINLGREEYKNALKLLKKCLDANKWDIEREMPMTVLHHLSKPLLHTLMEIYECQQR